MHHLKQAFEEGELQFAGELCALGAPSRFNRLLKQARKKKSVVYAKKPFGGPGQVLDYLGRYTHRVAITNHRLLRLNDGRVTFSWKDYRDSGASKEMTLEAEEFIAILDARVAGRLSEDPLLRISHSNPSEACRLPFDRRRSGRGASTRHDDNV